MFNLASLTVDIRAKDDALKSQLNGIKSSLGVMGVAMGTAIGGGIISMIDRALGAVMNFAKQGIAGSANLAESMSKVDAVFGKSSSVIKEVSDRLAKDFGLSKQAILDAGAGIGLVGKAAGQSQAQAAEMGAKMAQMAADASSFYNVPLDVALEKIKSGLVGEAEPMRAFGVLLDEESVKLKAVAMGLAKQGQELTQGSKVIARAALITAGLKDSTGDLARTADSTSNQWRKFTGQLENLAVSIGTSLAPAINSIINAAGDMATALSSAFEGSQAAFAAFAANVVETVNTIKVVWRNLPLVWEIVQIKALEMARNVIAVVASIPENLSLVAQYLGKNWLNLISDALNAVWTIFKHLGENIHEFGRALAEFLSDPTKGFHPDFKPLLDGFKATADKLPELIRPAFVNMDKEIADVARRMGDAEAHAAAGVVKKVEAAKAAAAAGPGATKTAKHDAFSGFSGAASDYRQHLIEKILTGGEKAKHDRDMLDQATKTRIAAEATAKNTAKPAAAIAG